LRKAPTGDGLVAFEAPAGAGFFVAEQLGEGEALP
jgi:hypothetical protein